MKFSVRCMVCQAKIVIDVACCETCKRPFSDVSRFAELALHLQHMPGCSNKDTAAVRMPNGQIRCNKLNIGEEVKETEPN